MTIACQQCGEPLPERLLRKTCTTYQPRFCSQGCFQLWRRESGQVVAWSERANAAQATFKQQYGQVPGYEPRRAALIASNQKNPRRTRKV